MKAAQTMWRGTPSDLARLLHVYEHACVVPTLPEGLVTRREILERVISRRDLAVVIVSGPAGFGKTTVAAQAAAQDGRPVAWVSIDKHSATPLSLLRSTAVAMHSVQPLSASVVDALLGSEQTWATATLPEFTAELRARHPFILVLDDVHELTQADALGCVDHLIDALPEGSMLIVTSRARPRLRVGRLLLAGHAARIDADDLMLSADEAADMAHGLGLDLSPDELAALIEKTEGWAAGLRLTMGVIAQSGTEASVSAPVDAAVWDYLTEELLERQPTDVVRFLIRTAILDALSGPLCDAVTGGTDSAVLLDQLAANGDLFLAALNGERNWFRVHPLVREVLEVELARREPQLVTDLHARASLWYEDIGDVGRAIMHAKKSGDSSRAENLVVDRLIQVATSGGNQTLGRWLSWFTDEECMRSAPLSVAQSWLAIGEGRPDDVEEWLARARTIGDDSPLSDGTPSAEYAITVTRAMVSPEPAERLDSLLEALLRTDATSSPFFGLASIIAAIHRWMAGDDASDLLWRSEPAWMRVPVLQAAALGYLAVMSFERGDLEQSASLRRRALRTIDDHHLSQHPTMTGTLLNLTLLGADLNDSQVDTDALLNTRALLPRIGHLAPRTRLTAYVLLAEIHLRLDDLDSVRTFVAAAEPLARREPWATAVTQRLEQAVDEWQRRLAANRAQNEAGPSSITPAERRVLAFLTTHLSIREIGEQTFRSASTVHTQSISLYRKLGVTNRSDAVTAARELGLID